MSKNAHSARTNPKNLCEKPEIACIHITPGPQKVETGRLLMLVSYQVSVRLSEKHCQENKLKSGKTK